LTALALAFALWGLLGFVAFMAWLARSHLGEHHEAQLAAVRERVSAVEARADPADLLKRIQALEAINTKRAFGG